ncbi:MFS transporter [Methylovulum psychrotolerans]|uniref:MFS transporter n=1 Tax=Methylovulum psychrotolerans TaxID=1704499 RepID=A0A2S5CKL3_9GAMM|nr:MFS transporter [Methylovulum psychrotolerans]POZ51355.1 MFS transporter [Methylovulum psychrotolerans]
MQATSSPNDSQTYSAWSPLRHKIFRALWLATIASNIGTWMQDVGAAWLMTSLSASPLMVALVQSSTTLPIVLLALPAGALADIVDRRRYLLITQLWMLLAAAGLGFCTLTGQTTGWLLLAFTFMLGCGSAMNLPAWAAIVPELVPKAELQAAITLNGLGINIARAIGPALAGLLIAAFGPASVFLLNAVSFFGVLAVLVAWKRDYRTSSLPAERLFSAIRSGLRYARHSQMLQAALIRGAAFFLFASALWALLPIFVRQHLLAGPSVYGALWACVGLGAVSSAFLLPHLRRHLDSDNSIRLASLGYAAILAVLASLNNLYLLGVLMFIIGASWLIVISSLQVAVQASLPEWVRARGISVFMMAFMGSMAGGSILWGYLADIGGLPCALVLAAAGMLLSILATWRQRISGYENCDFTPSLHWPAPITEQAPQHDQGPVLITLEYPVALDKRQDFLRLSLPLQKMRRRNGAYFWELFQDTAQADHFIECFMVESWLEHLRQHERVSKADQAVQDKINRCLIGAAISKVSHYIAVKHS